MTRHLGTLLGVVALLVSLLNLWLLWGVQGRLASLEDAAPGPIAATARPPGPGPAWGGPPQAFRAAPPPAAPATIGGIDVEDPVVQEQIAKVIDAKEEQREAERTQRFRQMIQSEVEAFAADEGLDQAVTDQVLAQISDRDDEMRAIRDEIRSGNLPMSEARAEMDAVRTASDTALQKLLGEERAARLSERVGPRPGGPGGFGPPGGPGSFGPPGFGPPPN